MQNEERGNTEHRTLNETGSHRIGSRPADTTFGRAAYGQFQHKIVPWFREIPMHTTSQPHRTIRAPRGRELSCKGWQQEAALRMLMNNLDQDVAEDPDQLIVYGG